jgi:hypothetical protein
VGDHWGRFHADYFSPFWSIIVVFFSLKVNNTFYLTLIMGFNRAFDALSTGAKISHNFLGEYFQNLLTRLLFQYCMYRDETLVLDRVY